MNEREVKLPQGTIRYRETGEGPPVVFVHGFLVNGRLWSGVADRLAAQARCIVPDWPMGSHRIPMEPDADLSPTGIADLIATFLERLDLDEVTIVANDSGGAMSQVLVTTRPERIARLVLTNCDTYEHFPPSLFKALPPVAKVPGVMAALGLPMRLGPIRRATFAPFAKHKIPPDVIDSWVEPGRDAAIRRDTGRFVAGMNKRYTMEAAERLRSFDRPVLLAWAPEDRLFKLSDAERLAEAIPDATLKTIPDARTFVPLDQPARVAELIEEFLMQGKEVPRRTAKTEQAG